MGSYNFKNLSSYDFELLTKDLLQEELALSLESFKSGRDSGIDLRYLRIDNKVIIQCKHYANSRYSNLIQELKKEKAKIEKLTPTRYIIVTSLGLTPLNKEEIHGLLSPYILNYDDIYDSEALNSLLRKYPSVEKNHFKLWLTSVAVLERIISSSIINNSQIIKESILKTIQVYVQCDNFFDALKILKKNHYCIISGIPGIGKTTLAKILSYKFIESGYEFISISNIKEGLELLAPEKKQIFYYDDFLGTNHFINKNEETELINFIEHISKSKVKRFIMTTREYIYKQAVSESEIFNRFNFQKCIIKQEDYNKKIKAKILYNHLYFANLPHEYYNNIVENGKYFEIIKHRNYTPRIIEWMTNIINVNSIKPNNYSTEFINNLNNPTKIWHYAFENFISSESRYILLLLGLIGGNVENLTLKNLYKLWRSGADNNDIVAFEIKFNKSLKELENTFISISISQISRSLIIKFHNPSIQDYIMDYINENSSILRDYLKIPSFYWDQNIFLLELTENESFNEYKEIIAIINDYKLSIIKELINNIDKEVILIDAKLFIFLKKYSDYNSRIFYILNLFQKNKIEIFKNDIDKLLIFYISNLELSNKITQKDRDIILKFFNFDNKYNNDKLRKLLNLLLINSSELDEISYLLDINSKLKFIDDEIIDEISEKIRSLSDDIDIDLDDIVQLEDLKVNIEEIYGFFNIEYPRCYHSIDDRIQEIEENEDHAEDEADYYMDEYKESRFEELMIDNEINNIFDTLK